MCDLGGQLGNSRFERLNSVVMRREIARTRALLQGRKDIFFHKQVPYRAQTVHL